MAKKLTAINEVHHEEDAVFVREDVLHVHEELVVYLLEDLHLKLKRVEALVVEHSVFADCLHGMNLASGAMLDFEHFAECALADELQAFKVLETGLDCIVSLEGDDDAGCGRVHERLIKVLQISVVIGVQLMVVLILANLLLCPIDHRLVEVHGWRIILGLLSLHRLGQQVFDCIAVIPGWKLIYALLCVSFCRREVAQMRLLNIEYGQILVFLFRVKTLQQSDDLAPPTRLEIYHLLLRNEPVVIL